ncbi:hypothetical protein [Chryseobacterium sp. OSA05B]|uniref:hypothetical protein n=1 Tax=Chryseobacterium sp. OSA05B TaxID=2862650 RepID=UPI001CBA96A1|nr:hypothetical protein [Chryseobacterium sp. OSA05B]
MKNLVLSIIAISISVLACKKNDTTQYKSPADSARTQNNISDTSTSVPKTREDSLTDRDSINTKTHISGRKTSNNNTGNGSGNINAAVSDSAHPAR